jgi:hypothetical protein
MRSERVQDRLFRNGHRVMEKTEPEHHAYLLVDFHGNTVEGLSGMPERGIIRNKVRE